MIHEDYELEELKKRVNYLETELKDMQSYFYDESQPIIYKCIRKAEKEMRHCIKIPCILSDDFDFLNIFEQICFIIQERSTRDYYGLKFYIETTIENIFDSLPKEEKFIMYSSGFDDPSDEILKAFYEHCNNFTNKKIRKAIEIEMW